MGEESAIKVINILLTADGGCRECAYYLIVKFAKEFHGFGDIAKDMYIERYGRSDFFNEEDF